MKKHYVESLDFYNYFVKTIIKKWRNFYQIKLIKMEIVKQIIWIL